MVYARPMTREPAAVNEVVVKVVDLHKSFGALAVLKGVSFEVRKGDVVSVIGASGSGKSTLLRCLNHLEAPTGGEVWIAGHPMGFRVGKQIQMVRRARFAGPLHVRIGTTELMIRRKEAININVLPA